MNRDKIEMTSVSAVSSVVICGVQMLSYALFFPKWNLDKRRNYKAQRVLKFLKKIEWVMSVEGQGELTSYR